MGVWVPGWQPRAKVRESVRPKFYLFDTGVVRTLANRIRDPLSDGEKGPLMETLVLHELRSAAAYLNCGGEIAYWRTPAGVEIDLVWSRADWSLAIEVKAATQWRREFSAPLRRALEERTVSRGYGVYLGDHSLREGDLHVLPFRDFVRRLRAGEVLLETLPVQ